MEFSEFRDRLVDWMNERYNGITFSAHSVVKNNGLHLTGISGLAQGSNVSPNIYINDLYDGYMQEGMTFGAAATILEQRYKMACKDMGFVQAVDLTDYDKVKDNLVCRIVNKKLNSKILQDAPHKLLADDLAVTYRFLQSKDENGIASALIYNKEFKGWNISLDELHEIALANTERLFPATIDSLVNAVAKSYGEVLPDELREEFMEDLRSVEQMENEVNMYVLSNDVGLNGATAILYPSVQKEILDRFGEDVYILPSSIHEVMVTPVNEETEEEFLQELVCEANQTAVGMQDYLADSVYKLQDGGLVNINQYGMEIDQAIEEAYEEPPESDLGFEL